MMLEVGSKDSYDSTEEYLFALWLQSASEFVLDAKYHPSPFVLFEARDGLRDHVYTADWMVFWRQNAKGVYFVDEGEKVPKTRSGEPVVPFIGNVSYIDVKGGFLGKNNSSGITFPINQKWVLDKYGIFINKTVITYEKKGLFFKTYAPDTVRIVATYVKGENAGKTKFKFNPRTFDEFTKGRVIL